MELQIVTSDPGVRGDTAQGGTKPATLETGVIIQVPLFIEQGERVRVDTRSGSTWAAPSARRKAESHASQTQSRITDTTLRDGHQSLWATRMRTPTCCPSSRLHGRGRLPVARVLGRGHLRRLPAVPRRGPLGAPAPHQAATCVRTPLQMLLRGQNLVGYRHYGDDIVRRFVYKAAENGIDIFRVFDALNDIRNFETAAAAIKETGKHFQGAVVYTISPVHSLDHYMRRRPAARRHGRRLHLHQGHGGAARRPSTPSSSSPGSRPRSAVPIQLHCHYIGGLAPMTYLKAIEAGVDVIDTATVPLAFGNSQPATEMVVTALIGTPYDTELDLEKLFTIAKYFEGVRRERGLERGVTSLTHMQVYSHQVPGGMISNLESQLTRAERAGPPARGAGRDPRGARRGRLPAAGHAHEPDRRHAGGAQRALGAALAHRARTR